jgi:hypothetical protein
MHPIFMGVMYFFGQENEISQVLFGLDFTNDQRHIFFSKIRKIEIADAPYP